MTEPAGLGRCPQCKSPDPYFESTIGSHGFLIRREAMIIAYCDDPFHAADVEGNKRLQKVSHD